MILTDIVSAALGLSCVILAGRKLVANFWVGYLYNAVLFALFWQNGLYASMSIQVLSFAINAWGHWRWTHPSDDEKDKNGELKVSHLSKMDWIKYITLLCAATWVMFLMLVHTDDRQPVLDASCTSLILLAQLMSAQKKWECWIVWYVVNVTNMILYIRAGLLFMPIVSGMYIVNGLWSLHTWRKDERNTEN